DMVAGITEHGKETREVTTQDADVEGVHVSDSSKLTAEEHLPSSFTSQPNLGSDEYRTDHTTQTTEMLLGYDRLETEQYQDPSTEYGAVCASINQEGNTRPGAVTRQDLTPYYGPLDTIAEENPLTVYLHRYASTF